MYGLDFFYDSCYDKIVKGLELLSLVVIDVIDNIGYIFLSW